MLQLSTYTTTNFAYRDQTVWDENGFVSKMINRDQICKCSPDGG